MPQGIVKMGVHANIFDRHNGTNEEMCTFIINQTDHNISFNIKILQTNITISYTFWFCYSQYRLSILNFPYNLFPQNYLWSLLLKELPNMYFRDNLEKN